MVQEKERTLNIPTNYFCNQECIFCSEGDKAEFQFLKNNQDKYILDLLKDSVRKYNKVIFTSGEPTLVPKIEEYINYSKKLNFKQVGLITNGSTLENKKVREKIKNLDEITISIHGIGKTHNYITNVDNVFNKVIRGILKLKKENKNINILISFVLNKYNLKDFYKMAEFFINKIGVDLFLVNTMRPDGRGKDNFDDLSIKYTNFIETFNNLSTDKQDFLKELIKNNKLNIMDIPICIMRQVLDRKTAEICYGKVEIRDTLESGEHISVNNYESDKTYINKCKKCNYIGKCEGIYKDYLNTFGENEFKCIQ